MVGKLNWSRIKNAKDNKMTRKIIADFIEIALEAIGRFLVRSTFLSKSRSQMSLITQPAERIKNAPIKNKAAK